ncbi:unnamed protein product [Symbiodinium sp. CCMP2456]|nr:unnamed protein product [Symbiodinium sp. CCMP2456]
MSLARVPRCAATGAGTVPRAAPQDLDPLHSSRLENHEDASAAFPKSAGRIPKSLSQGGIQPQGYGALPHSPRAGLDVAAGGMLVESSDGIVSSAQDEDLLAEIRSLEQRLREEITWAQEHGVQLAGPDPESTGLMQNASSTAHAASTSVGADTVLAPGVAELKVQAPARGPPASEFAHLTRSEYIKLKAQRRHAALTIQMQIKVYLVRQYMCWSSRVPSIKRIQAYCWRYLAQVQMLEHRRNAQLKFALLMVRLQARIRLRLARKKAEKLKQQEEEAKLWHAALQKLQSEASVKIAAKCRSFIAGTQLCSSLKPSSVGEIQRSCRVHGARVYLLDTRRRFHAAQEIQRMCRVHWSRLQVRDSLAVAREQERMRLRAIMRLQTLLKGMRARQELHHLRVLNDEAERKRRRLEEERVEEPELPPVLDPQPLQLGISPLLASTERPFGMIVYEHGTWGIQVLLRLRGSVIPKALVWAVPCAAATVLLHLYWNREKAEDNREMEGIHTIWSAFTFVLGFLIVFRSNQAYSRFWESVTLFHQISGEWTSAFSNILSFCSPDPQKQEQVDEFRQYLTRLMSLLHCSALQTTCELDDDSLEVLDLGAVSSTGLLHFRDSPDRCETVMLWLQRLIMDAERSKLLEAPPPILSRAFQELSRGMVSMTNLRKIRDVPFPFPYSQFLSCILLAHWILTPLVASQTVMKPWWAGIIVFVVVTSYWTLFYIAQEIDQPFGEDANDLPVREMQRKFNAKLEFFIRPDSYTVPSLNLDASQHICLLASTFSVALSRGAAEAASASEHFMPITDTGACGESRWLQPDIGNSLGGPMDESIAAPASLMHDSLGPTEVPEPRSMEKVERFETETLRSIKVDEEGGNGGTQLLDWASLEQLVSLLLLNPDQVSLQSLKDCDGLFASMGTAKPVTTDALKDASKRLDDALTSLRAAHSEQKRWGLDIDQLTKLQRALSQLDRIRAL